MAIKVVCDCGMEVITFQKKPGEVIVCKKCGNQIIIPHVVENETQVFRDLGSSTMDGTYHAKKQKKDNPSTPLMFKGQENNNSPSKNLSGIKTCPACLEESKTSAVICVGCGYNFKTGEKGIEPSSELPPPQKGRKRKKRDKCSNTDSAISKHLMPVISKLAILTLIISVLTYWGPGIFKNSYKFIFSTLQSINKGGENKIVNSDNSSPDLSKLSTQTSNITSSAQNKQSTHAQTPSVPEKEPSFTIIDYSETDFNMDITGNAMFEINIKSEQNASKDASADTRKKYGENNFLDITEKNIKENPPPEEKARLKPKVSFETKSGRKMEGILTNVPPRGAPEFLKVVTIEKTVNNKTECESIKLTDIKQEYLYLFDTEAYYSHLEDVVSRQVSNFKDQKGYFERHREQYRIKYYQMAGYGWSKAGKKWLPVKPDRLKGDDSLSVIKYAKDTDEFRTPLSPASNDIYIDNLEASITSIPAEKPAIHFLFSGNERKDFKNEKFSIKLYRAPERDGRYRLIYSNQLPCENSLYSTLIADINPSSEKKNHVYYRADVFTASGKTVRIFEPLKVPVIPKPTITENAWTWEPIEPRGEDISGFIYDFMETKSGKVFLFASPLKKCSHSFSDYPPGIRVYGGIETTPASDWKYYKPSLLYLEHTQLEMRKGTTNFYQGEIILPNFTERKTMKFSSGVSLSNLIIEGKTLQVSKDSREIFKKVPCGQNVKVNFNLSKNTANGQRQLEFYLPPEPPVPHAKADKEGTSVSWDDMTKIFDMNFFSVKPVISFSDSSLLNSACRFKVPFDTCSYTEKDLEYGRNYGYYITLKGGFIKAKAWLETVGVIDCHVRVDLYGRADGKKGKAIAKCNKGKGQNSPDNILANLDGRPIRVGFGGNQMNHERTGMLEIYLIDKIFKSLDSIKEFEVYDRINTASILREMKLFMGEMEITPQPIDFLVQLRDYSHEADNGIEVWITDLHSRDLAFGNPPMKWRIAQIDLKNFKDLKIDEMVIQPLVKKILEKYPGEYVQKAAAELEVNNIILNSLTPVEQASQVWQYESIGESVFLKLSNKLTGRNILSREDWLMVNQERLTIEASGTEIPAPLAGNVMISGFIWNGQENLNYLFVATEPDNGRFVDSISLSGNDFEKVSSQLSEWCNAMKLRKFTKISMPPTLYLETIAKIPDSEYANIIDKADDVSSQSYFRYIASGTATPLKIAEEKWLQGHKALAFKILRDEWKKTKALDVGLALSRYYSEANMYSAQVVLLEEMIKSGIGGVELSSTLNKAKSLSANPSRGLKIRTLDTKITAPEIIDGRINLDKLELGKDSKAILENKTITNPVFQKQFFSARKSFNEEWNPLGHFFTKERFITQNDLSFNASHFNKYGIWEEVKARRIKDRRTEQSKTYIKTRTWQSYQLFPENNDPEYLYEVFNSNRNNYLFYNDIIRYPQVKILVYNTFKLDEPPKLITAQDYLKKDISFPEEVIFSSKPPTFLSLDILTKLGDPKAKGVMDKIMTCPLNEKHKFSTLAYFRMTKGDKKARELVLASDGRLDKDDTEMVFFIASKNKDYELISSILRKGTPASLKNIRWGDRDTVKKVLADNAEYISPEDYCYLIEGFRFIDLTPNLMKIKSPTMAAQAAIVLNGKPLEEIGEMPEELNIGSEF